MKKSYNTPETQLQEMEVQGFLMTSPGIENGDASEGKPVDVPGQNQKLFDFEW